MHILTICIHFIADGTMLTLDDVWKLFRDHYMTEHQSHTEHQFNMLNILTQMEHPILFKPFMTLHPCQISEVLHQLPHSSNKTLTFLSTYGPSVFLTFDLNYAKHFNQLESNKDDEFSTLK